MPRGYYVMTLVSALAALVARPQCALANWEYTTWGMTPDQVVAGSHGKASILPSAQRYRDDDAHWEMAVKGSYSDGPVDLDVGFTFDTQGKGLQCVFYNALGQQAAGLKDTLIKRYGPPQHEGTFSGTQTLSWKTPDQIDFAMGNKPVAAAVTHCAP